MVEKKTAVIIALIIILAAAFTADDVTGIGELADPLEFLVLGLIGYFGGKHD